MTAHLASIRRHYDQAEGCLPAVVGSPIRNWLAQSITRLSAALGSNDRQAAAIIAERLERMAEDVATLARGAAAAGINLADRLELHAAAIRDEAGSLRAALAFNSDDDDNNDAA